MVNYPYPFLVVMTQLFSWLIVIIDCICLLTGSPRFKNHARIYYTEKMGVTEFSKLSQLNDKLALPR